MDGNTALVLLAASYGLYLAWCRWLEYRAKR